MYKDDNEALAAEYVLGTLSANEREHAEGLLLIDPGFEVMVRQWERRLGELNVMVEAVEPPTEVWTKIKAGILSVPRREAKKAEAGEIGTAGEAEPPRIEDAAPPVLGTQPESEAETAETAETAEAAEKARELEPAEDPSEAEGRLAAFELSLLAPNGAADTAGTRPSAQARPANIERGADAIYLAERLRTLRRLTAALAVLAALLAAYVAVWQIAPDLIPARLRPSDAGLLARGPSGAEQPVPDRLVAVLQQQPTTPAFLLTIDRTSRMLTVRSVSAKADAAHNYELWLLAPRAAKPRSLGLVGGKQYTQRPLPAGFDADTLGTATFEISYEPAGGSKTGAPSGPILFTGQAFESLPASPPPKT